MKKIKNNRIITESLLNTWATFIYFFVQWFLTVILTRISGYRDSGIFTFTVTFANIFLFVANFGVRNFQISDVKNKYSANDYISTRIITSLISLPIFCLTLVFSRYGIKTLVCCSLMYLYKMLESYNDVLMGEMQRMHRYEWIAISYTLKSLLIASLFTLLLFNNFNLYVCIISMCIAFSFVLFFYDTKKLDVFGFYKFSYSNSYEIIKECFTLAIVSVLDSLLIFIPKHIIEIQYNEYELGVYGNISIVIVVLSTLANAIWGSIVPRYSEYINDNKWRDFDLLTFRIFIIEIVFSIGAYFIGKIIGPFFYSLLFGKEILDFMSLLKPTIINSLLLLFNSFFICIFIPLNKKRVLLSSDIISVITCYVISNRLSAKYGLIGVSYGLSIALLIKFIYMLIMLLYYRKYQQ